MDKIVAIALSSSLMTCLSVGAQSKSWAQVAPFLFLAQAQVPAQSDEGMAIEEALPQDSSKRMDRLAKNDRHNGGGCNLTTATADHPCFFESIWPRALPLIPLKKTALAVAGQVVKIQPYVSGDGSRIYREITIDVDEVYKRPRGFELSRDRTILIDEPGGAIRLQSGAIVRDGTVICGLGQPNVGGHYVFFANTIHEGLDLTLAAGYELIAGRVYRMTDQGEGGVTPIPGPSAWTERSLLDAVRKKARH